VAEIKGYTCDGGCGATTALDSQPGDSLAQHGWSTTFTPHGYPTLYTCSMPCLIRAAERIGGRTMDRELRHG
jgi:hypothetical protein